MGPADILLLLDASSGSQQTFDHIVRFARSLVRDSFVGPLAMQYNVLTYATKPNAEFWFSSYTDNEHMLQALRGLKVRPGTSNLAEALTVSCVSMSTLAVVFTVDCVAESNLRRRSL